MSEFRLLPKIWGYFWGWAQVQKLFWVLLNNLNNYTFDLHAVLALESTIPDGRPVGLDLMGIKPTQPSLKLGLGLSLAIIH